MGGNLGCTEMVQPVAVSALPWMPVALVTGCSHMGEAISCGWVGLELRSPGLEHMGQGQVYKVWGTYGA